MESATLFRLNVLFTRLVAIALATAAVSDRNNNWGYLRPHL